MSGVVEENHIVISASCQSIARLFLVMYIMKIQSPKTMLLEKKGENYPSSLFQLYIKYKQP